MKYIIYVLIIHVVFSISLIGQTQNMKVDYTQVYYPLISQAKLMWLEKDYEKALQFYQKSFKNVRQGFSTDYYNAMICAVLLKKEQLVSHYIDTLLNKGIQFSEIKQKLIENDSTLNGFSKSKDWKKIEKKFKNFKPKYKRPHAKQIRDYFEYLEKLDQKVRNNPDFIYKKMKDTIEFKGIQLIMNGTKKNISKVDSILVVELKNMTKQYGFINEDLVGKKYMNDSGDVPFYVLLLHYTYLKEFKSDFLPILYQAVKDGYFYADTYTYIYDRAYRCPDFGENINVYGTQALYLFPTQHTRNGYTMVEYKNILKTTPIYLVNSYIENENLINKKRKELGINTFKENVKLCLSTIHNKTFMFDAYFAPLVDTQGVLKKKFENKLTTIENWKK